MERPALTPGLALYTTCPPSYTASSEEYLRRVTHVARMSESAGCAGALIYTDNGTVDAWMVAQAVLAHTRAFTPLIAVQPIYLHPYTAAKMVATLAFLYGRRVCLNMVAGGFKNDLEALNDPTPHDERYARLIEYTTLMMRLLKADEPVTFEGRYYTVRNIRLAPALPEELLPGLFVSGSSPAGLDAARALDALAVQYPKPSTDYATEPPPVALNLGIRIGIVARESNEAAWAAARARFPESRKGQLTRQLAFRVSDSEWHRQIADLKEHVGEDPESPYWTVPFDNYHTSCPYLVGSHERVADEVARYAGAGYRTIIVDVPHSAEELHHIGLVCRRATERVSA